MRYPRVPTFKMSPPAESTSLSLPFKCCHSDSSPRPLGGYWQAGWIQVSPHDSHGRAREAAEAAAAGPDSDASVRVRLGSSKA